MSVPENPAAMPDYILSKLLQGEPGKEATNNRAQEKFANSVRSQLEADLKDSIFHEIDLELDGTVTAQSKDFVNACDSSIPVALLSPANIGSALVVELDHALAQLLPVLYLGGDLGTAPSVENKQYTNAEIGLIEIFAKLIAKSLKRFDVLQVENVQTLLSSEVDFEEIKDCASNIFSFQIKVGACSGLLKVAIPAHLVSSKGQEGDSISDLEMTDSNGELRSSLVQTNVKIGTEPVTLRQVQNLRVGDCIGFSKAAPLSGSFVVEGQEIFLCEVGRAGKNYSIKLSQHSSATTPGFPAEH